MELGDLFNVGASVASGGVFGLVGSVIGSVGKYFHARQQQAFEKEKWAHETALLELQMKTRAAETEQEIALAAQQGSWQGLSESYKALATIGKTHTWVNDVRALFRPLLTLTLWAISGWFFFQIGHDGFSQWLETGDIDTIVRYMIYTAFFSASTSTAWWFGDRALSPPKDKHR
jgi:uncharacterized membrane protein